MNHSSDEVKSKGKEPVLNEAQFFRLQKRRVLRQVIRLALKQSSFSFETFKLLAKECEKEGLKLTHIKEELIDALKAVTLSSNEQKEYLSMLVEKVSESQITLDLTNN